MVKLWAGMLVQGGILIEGENPMPKLKESFKPINIINLNAKEIIFYEMIGNPYSKDKAHRYEGSIPVSLDFLKMVEFCKGLKEKDIDNKGLLPTKPYKAAALKASEAIINVAFDDITVEKINHLDVPLELDSPDDELKNLYEKFVKLFYVNLEYYRKKQYDSEKSNEYQKIKEIADRYRAEIYDTYEPQSIHHAVLNSFNNVILHYAKNCDFVGKALEAEQIDNKSKLLFRYMLYEKGFCVKYDEEIRHYRMYKRSSSKSKKGSVLFIYDQLYDDMMKWTRLGLEMTDESCDLTSMKAYEALVMSSIVNTVKIPRDGILLLDSVKSPKVPGNRMILIYNDNKVKLVNKYKYKKEIGKEYIHNNILWDGQALVDSSIFTSAGYNKENPQGMMLLRNSFFKACAFNTNIQKYYKEYFKDKEDKTVTDMFGRKIPYEKIKMIVTIDSLKIDKFADYFKKQLKSGDLEARRKLYEHWLNNIDETFGIVKEEHETYLGHGKYHTISYQILNTLPITELEMKKVLEDENNYVKMLQDDNDVSVMYDHLSNISTSSRKAYFISNMLRYSPGFENSRYYRDFKKDEIRRYKEKLKIGKIKVKGDFYVLCSMPMEMLEYSAHGEYEKIKPYLNDGYAYINGIEEEEDIVLCRYPHMNSGSVCTLKQKRIPCVDKYFNLNHKNGSNIVIVSPWDSDIMIKLGGADFDSDTAFYIKDETIKEAALRLNDIELLGPKKKGPQVAVADDSLKGESKKGNYKSMLDHTKLDDMLSLSQITIGQISNDAQLFNSYFWNKYYEEIVGETGEEVEEAEKEKKRYLNKVYRNILILSALNELEIDKAKHSIVIEPDSIRRKIRNTTFNGEYILERKKENDRNTQTIYVPYFFTLISDNKKRYITKEYKYWNTPVDYIAKCLTKTSAKGKDIEEDLSKFFDMETKDKVDPKTLINIRDRVGTIVDAINEINKNKYYDESTKAELRKSCVYSFWVNVRVNSITTDMMKELIASVFKKYKTDNNRAMYPKLGATSARQGIALGVLFEIGDFVSCFQNVNPAIECIKDRNKKNIPILKYNIDGNPDDLQENEIVIWGDVYTKNV